MIKLVATDIDGTLIRESSSVLPEEIFDLIRELRKRDIYFAAASGRQYMGLKRLFAPVADQIKWFQRCMEGRRTLCFRDQSEPDKRDAGICKTFPEYASDLIDNKSDAFYRK